MTLTGLLHRLRALFRASDAEREREEEIAFHLSLDAMHGEQQGLTPELARAKARRNFGNVTAINEERRAVPRLAWLDEFAQNIRYAARVLRRSPGYTIGAAFTLAVGIGATTGVFSIINAVLFRSMPYADVGKLTWIVERNDSTGALRVPSYPTFQDWKRTPALWRNTIDDMVYARGNGVWMDGPGGAERVGMAAVTPGFFQLMGTKPYLGRTFLPEEERPDANRTVVLSFRTWMRYFHGDKSVIGHNVTIDSLPTYVAGVMPYGFVYPEWTPSMGSAMWTPIASIAGTDNALAKRGVHADARLIARLTAKGDSAGAAAAVNVIQSRLATEFPAETKGWSHTAVLNVRDLLIGDVGSLLNILAGAVALVLLLACVNVANLTFVRGAARSRELAVRAALGAGRWRVIRQLLTESVLLGAMGAAGGIFIASAIVGLTRGLASGQIPHAAAIAINPTVLTFAIVLAVVAAVASSILPSFRVTQSVTVETLRSATQSSVGGRRDSRVRNALVVAQLSVALVLLIGTGLLLQSFRNISAVPLGFDPKGLVDGAIHPPAKYAQPQQAASLYRELLERMRNVPGVRSVAVVNHPAISLSYISSAVSVDGSTGGASTFDPLYRTVSEGYLQTMGMQMASGKWFTDEDMRTPEKAVVNESLARKLFPQGVAVGRTITVHRASQNRDDFGQPVRVTIVGVVKDVHQYGQETDPATEIYVPYTLEVWPWATLVFRADNPAITIPLVQRAVEDVDPSLRSGASKAFGGFGALSDRLAGTMYRRKLVLWTIAAFAFAALMLAAGGMYSVMSYGVALRTRELGVRVALGATRGGIVRLVIAEGARLAIVGVVIGVGVAMGAARLIRAMLFHTPTVDVAAYGFTVLVLLVAAGIACYLPARRAARLSPVEAIRES